MQKTSLTSAPSSRAATAQLVEAPRTPRLDSQVSPWLHGAASVAELALPFVAPELVPVVAGANAALYLSEGHTQEAAIETACMIPFMKWGAVAKSVGALAEALPGLGRLGKAAVEVAKDAPRAAGAAKAVAREAAEAAGASGKGARAAAQADHAVIDMATRRARSAGAAAAGPKPHWGDGNWRKYALKPGTSLSDLKSFLPGTPGQWAKAGLKAGAVQMVRPVAYCLHEPSHDEAWRLKKTLHPLEAFMDEQREYFSDHPRAPGTGVILTPSDNDAMIRSAKETMTQWSQASSPSAPAPGQPAPPPSAADQALANFKEAAGRADEVRIDSAADLRRLSGEGSEPARRR